MPTVPTLEPNGREENEAQGFCPRCGAAYEPHQEYCLECGERLPVNRGVVGVLAGGWQRRLPWYPGDWIWPALGLLVLAIVATVLAVMLGPGGSSSAKTIVATGESVPVGPGALTGSVPTVTTSTAPLPTAPEATVPEQPTSQAPKPSGGLARWPAGKSGFTVVLESIPTSSGRAAALAHAKRARAAGLDEVGVIDSSSYSSFHPGYFVVFYGIFGSFSEASNAASTAHAHGYRDAYPKPVTR
jgi:hypothetical protein